MIAIGLILIVIGLIGLIGLLILDNDSRWALYLATCANIAGFTSLIIGVGLQILCSQPPSALDVYQGKTTLEITYRDSIAVDSVVVFKPEFKK